MEILHCDHKKKRILTFCFVGEKNLKEDQIDKKKQKQKKKCVYNSFFRFRPCRSSKHCSEKYQVEQNRALKKPQSTYEQYVNKGWQLNHGKYGRKQNFLRAV